MNAYGILVESYRKGKSNVPGGKPLPVPICPPKILHGLQLGLSDERSVTECLNGSIQCAELWSAGGKDGG